MYLIVLLNDFGLPQSMYVNHEMVSILVFELLMFMLLPDFLFFRQKFIVLRVNMAETTNVE